MQAARLGHKEAGDESPELSLSLLLHLLLVLSIGQIQLGVSGQGKWLMWSISEKKSWVEKDR